MSEAAMTLPSHSQPVFAITPWVAGIAVWLTMLSFGWWFMNASDTREISSLQIEGDFKRVPAQAVEAAVRDRLSQGFVELALENVKADVEKLPWVARARVERSWPAGVHVRIWEREPFARWAENSLLDTQAQVFTPSQNEMPQDLPSLSGESGSELAVMEAYQRLSDQLVDTAFALAGLTLNARGEWTGQTLTGIGLRFGRTINEDKIGLLRGAISRATEQRMSEVNYVDLRYTNGFAVGWKEQPKLVTGETHG